MKATVTPPRTNVVEKPGVTPSPPKPLTNEASPKPAETNLQVARVPDRPVFKPGGEVTINLPRYTYRSPAKPRAGDRKAAERSFAQGFQAHQANRLASAVNAYRAAANLDPSYFDAHYNMGLASASLGNVKDSLSAYESALAIRPESLDARYNFALVLKQAGYPIDAADELNKLVMRFPNDTRLHLALGNLYAQVLKQSAKAREHYRKLLQLDPRHPQAAAVQHWLSENPG